MLKRIISVFWAVLLFAAGFCMIPVSAAEQDFRLSRELVNLYPRQSFRLRVTDTRHEYKFSSADEDIVKVDKNGIIHAVSVGITEVKCEFATGDVSVCTVNVKQGKPPEKLNISKQSITLLKGETESISAEVVPSGTNDYISFTSSDESVAAVDQNGVIEALSPGVTVITVESESSAVAATCTVRVLRGSGNDPFGSDINGVLYDISGERLIHTPVELKSNTYSSKLTTDSEGRFRFSNVNTGNYLLTVNSGITDAQSVSANINITSNDMRITCIQAETGLNVLYGSSISSGIAVRDIILTQSSVDLNTGDNYDIGCTVYPAEAENIKLVFSSSDTAVADVDESGRVTAVGEGTARIFVSSSDGRIMKKCTFHVTQGGIGNFGWAIIFLQILVIVIVLAVFIIQREQRKKQVVNE